MPVDIYFRRAVELVLPDFNPRTPCGVRPFCARQVRSPVHFNPRTPCGVRLYCAQRSWMTCIISIHAPLAGCDEALLFPDAEGDDFNPRTPCGVRRDSASGDYATSAISIHAPLAGCDIFKHTLYCLLYYFNPRTPCGVRRRRPNLSLCLCSISIHAPLAGCDRERGDAHLYHVQFQSTHPLRGATKAERAAAKPPEFQSTHPLRGATVAIQDDLRAVQNFNPRTPCGVRLTVPYCSVTSFGISIHAPLAGCDLQTRARRRTAAQFQSTHPLRGATRSACR